MTKAKKSFRKIPAEIREQIRHCNGKPFVIFAVLRLKTGSTLPNLPGVNEAIATNQALPERVLPDPAKGVWARRNTEGWEIVRKDWPMVTKDFSHESPNWGDWSLGSHDVTFERDVYQREFFPGHGWTISIKRLEDFDGGIVAVLELDRIFEAMPEDEREFLFALNLFQESVGKSSIRPTDILPSNYISSLVVDWELLPVGNLEEVLPRIYSRLGVKQEDKPVVEERTRFFSSLKPRNLVVGTSSFARYLGAQIDDDFVVFENVRYGNAVYVMFENWQKLSKMSRVDLLKSDEKFVRIIHRPGWKSRVRQLVNEFRSSRK